MSRISINPFIITKFYITMIILSIKQIQVSTISEIVNRYSKNIFRISVNSNLISDYTISITLPNQIVVDASNLECQLLANNANYNVSAKSCIYLNSNGIQKVNIVIKTNLDLLNAILDITILTGILNPPSTYVENGEINVYDNNNNLVPAFTETIIFTYEPNIFTCALTTSLENAGEVANYTFSFMTTSPILKGGSIMINFPYFNQDSGAPSNSLISLINVTPTITNISGIDANSSLIFDSNNVKTWIKLVNIFPNNNSDTNNRITFTITNILNPPSLDTLTGFTITTLDSRNFSIDKSQASLKVSVPMKIKDLSISFKSSIISTNSLVNFTFSHEKFLAMNIQIRLTFPSDYPISYSSGFSWISGVDKMSADIPYNINGNVMLLRNPTNMYYKNNNFHTFSLFSLRNPTSTKPTGKFSFEILTSLGNLMYVYDGNLTYTASPGSFPTATVLNQSSTVKSLTDYTLNFTTLNKLLSNSYIKITFPKELKSQMQIGVFICALNSANSEVLMGSCEYTYESNIQILFIRNAFKNGFNANIGLSLTLQKIINYNCAGNSSSFTIESFTDENYVMDQRNTGITVTFTEGELKNPQITPSSKIIWDTNKYEFKFTITNALEQSSIIEIIFPRDIVVNKSQDTSNLACELTINNLPKTNFTCKLSSQIITITNFSSDVAQLPPETLFRIKIPEVQNKRNLKESEAFSLNTYLNPGCKLDKNFQELKVKSTLSLKIISITVTPESKLNGDMTSHEIVITPGGKIISGDQVRFSIPSQLTSSSGASSILILGNGVQTKTQILNKDNSGNFFKIKIESDVVDAIKFKMLAIKNYFSIKPYEKFDFAILDSTNDTLETYDSAAAPIVLTQVSNKLANAKIESPNSSTIMISFSTFNRIPLNGIIKIKISPKIDNNNSSIGGFVCEDSSLMNKKDGLVCVYNEQDSVITVENKFVEKAAAEAESIKITLSNLKFVATAASGNDANNANVNVNSNQSSQNVSIDIETFEKIEALNVSTNTNEILLYSIDKAAGVELALGCNKFCAKCLANGTTCTQCTSSQYILKDGVCSADCPDSNPFIFEDLSNPNTNSSNKSCVKACPDGYFADTSEKKCLKCIAPCNECFSKTLCKNCIEGLLLYPAQQSCSVRCPLRSTKASLPEAKGFVCVDCHESCLSCESSDYAKCTSCASTKILYNNSCIAPGDCPKGTVAFEGKCAFCEAKCEHCAQQPSKCLKCAAGFALDEASSSCFIIQEQCAAGYFLDNQKKCSLCDKTNPQCFECNGEFACRKCMPGFSLEVSKCVRTCSEGFYFDANSLECRRCSASCRTCAQDMHKCTSCFEFAFLNEFKCDFACPEGFFKDGKNRVCKRCENTCKSCSDEVANNISASESSLIPASNSNNNNCLQCVNGLYLLSGVCIFKCPSSYISDDPTRRCISSRLFNTQKKNIFLEYKKIENTIKHIYNFYFAYAAFAVLFLFYFYKSSNSKLFYFGVCTGLVSLIDLAIHAYVCYLYFSYSYTLYFVILGGAFCFRVILNNIFIFAYNSHINKDTAHRYWISYNNLNHFFANVFILIEFKTIRLTYSRFLKGFCKFGFFDNKFSKYSRIHKVYRLFRLFDMLVVDVAIFLSGSLFLYFNIKYNYIWFLTGEFIVIRLIILAYALIDLMVNKKIDQDFFYQTKSRIDVVPKLKAFSSPYMDKYNLKIKGFENIDDDNSNKNKYNLDYSENSSYNSSHLNRKTDCNTIKRSNSEVNLFSNLLEKNKTLKKFNVITKEDIDVMIPRDDSYLIQSSENPLRYYSKLLKENFTHNNNYKIKILAKAYRNIKELEFIERRNSLALKNKHKFSLHTQKAVKNEANSHSRNKSYAKNYSEITYLNTCPINIFISKTEENKITEKQTEKRYFVDYACTNFVDFEKIKNKKDFLYADANNNNAGKKVIYSEHQSSNGNSLSNFNKNKFNFIEEKNNFYYNFGKDNGIFNEQKKKNFEFNIEDDFSRWNDDVPNIHIRHLNRNSFLFDKCKSDLVHKTNLNDDISFMNYSDRSSNCLEEK